MLPPISLRYLFIYLCFSRSRKIGEDRCVHECQAISRRLISIKIITISIIIHPLFTLQYVSPPPSEFILVYRYFTRTLHSRWIVYQYILRVHSNFNVIVIIHHRHPHASIFLSPPPPPPHLYIPINRRPLFPNKK